jgi:hypothetical protein
MDDWNPGKVISILHLVSLTNAAYKDFYCKDITAAFGKSGKWQFS